MAPLAEILDTHALVEMLWTAVVAGLTVTLAFALALVGATRAFDLNRNGRVAQAGAYVVLGAVSISFVGAAIVLGIVAITTK